MSDYREGFWCGVIATASLLAAIAGILVLVLVNR